MKETFLLIAFVVLFSNLLIANEKKEKDKKAIKEMCGCYDVKFNFAETFIYSDDENYNPSDIKHDGALEWVELVEDEDNKIVMQHILIVNTDEGPKIIKHWRQDWLYENTEFYMYHYDKQWNYETKQKSEVQNQWTQRVFQVDDSPRYEGSSSWVHIDGKSYWENTTNAPLPRREYTKRDDYNVTIRSNRHEITDFGWVHDQDNKKIIRQNGKEDIILAEEKGYNTYTKIDNSKCKLAIDWWNVHNKKWELIRENWDLVFARDKNIKLKKKHDGRPLYKYMFELEPSTNDKEIKNIINNFLIK